MYFSLLHSWTVLNTCKFWRKNVEAFLKTAVLSTFVRALCLFEEDICFSFIFQTILPVLAQRVRNSPTKTS